MPFGSDQWDQGNRGEYAALDGHYGNRDAAPRFIEALRGGDLMAAVSSTFFPDRAEFDRRFERTARNWFGIGGPTSMWKRDSILTPSQIHAVMLAVRLEVASIVSRADNPSVFNLCKCGSPRFSAHVSDDGHGKIGVYVRGPYNMSEALDSTPEQVREGWASLLGANIGALEVALTLPGEATEEIKDLIGVLARPLDARAGTPGPYASAFEELQEVYRTNGAVRARVDGVFAEGIPRDLDELLATARNLIPKGQLLFLDTPFGLPSDGSAADVDLVTHIPIAPRREPLGLAADGRPLGGREAGRPALSPGLARPAGGGLAARATDPAAATSGVQRLDLDTVLEWAPGEAPPAGTADVQGNILAPHRRDHVRYVLLHVSDAAAARATLARLARERVTTARDELLLRESRVRTKPAHRAPRGPFVGVLLATSAYEALGAELPADDAFQGTMRAARERIDDPDVTNWEQPYRDGVDVMVLLASGTAESLEQLRADVGAQLPGFEVVGEESGYQFRNDEGQTVEHFGYVDGISGPRFIRADVEFERANNRYDAWDPAFPMGAVLVECADGGYGSYAVFRKLEQNVRRFKDAERRLRDSAKIQADTYEPSAEVLVGRTVDGRPLQLAAQLPAEATENGFDHAKQPGCPVGAHIRKANARDTSARSSVIARRGIPYGTRTTPPHLPPPDGEKLPESGVGLLFHAHMADIRSQFESMQQALNHVDDGTPRDPIAGQGTPPRAARGTWRDPRGGGETPDADELGSHVTLRGGAYLFAPSLPFLRALDR